MGQLRMSPAKPLTVNLLVMLLSRMGSVMEIDENARLSRYEGPVPRYDKANTPSNPGTSATTRGANQLADDGDRHRPGPPRIKSRRRRSMPRR